MEGKRRSKSTLHFTVWTMNGGALPESIQRKMEEAVRSVLDDSEVRTLIHVKRF